MASSPPPVKKDPSSGALVLAALGLCTGGFLALIGFAIGVHALVQAIRHPRAHWRKSTASVAIVANLFVLSATAFAFRSLLRAKPSALEAAAIGDVRTMISAQAAYLEQNDGFYEARLDCLARPTTCLPAFPKSGQPFLGPSLASLEQKTGYRRAFHPGPPAAPRPGAGGRSRRPGVLSFAYTAVPVAYEGMRAFCGDATGRICFTRDGREPGVTPEGRCDLSTCEELR